MSKVDVFVKDLTVSYGFTKLVFDTAKNILTTGAIYYVANRYDSKNSKYIAWFLVWVMIVPVVSATLSVISPFKKESSTILWSGLGAFIVSIPVQYYFIDATTRILDFISSK